MPGHLSLVPAVLVGALAVMRECLAIRAMDTVLAVLVLPEAVAVEVAHTVTVRLAQPLDRVQPGQVLPQILVAAVAAGIPGVMVGTVAPATVFYIG